MLNILFGEYFCKVKIEVWKKIWGMPLVHEKNQRPKSIATFPLSDYYHISMPLHVQD